MPTIHFPLPRRNQSRRRRRGAPGCPSRKTMVTSTWPGWAWAQSELGFPFLFHEVPYGAQRCAGPGGRVSGRCGCPDGAARQPPRGARASPLVCATTNLSSPTSDQISCNKFRRGRLDREAIIQRLTARRGGGEGRRCADHRRPTAEDGSRTDEGFLLEFATRPPGRRARTRLRYCDTIGGDKPRADLSRFADWPRGPEPGRDALPQRPGMALWPTRYPGAPGIPGRAGPGRWVTRASTNRPRGRQFRPAVGILALLPLLRVAGQPRS